MNVILKDPGAWIALGISALFLVAAVVMHRIFIKILKQPVPPELEAKEKSEKENPQP